MILEDGLYEVKDLFYEDVGFAVAVAGGKIRFSRGAGPEARFRLEILYSDRDFSRPVRPPGFSKERGEFAKSLVKTVLASSASSAEFAENVEGALAAYADGSGFEKSFVVTELMNGGLSWFRRVGSGGWDRATAIAGVAPDFYSDNAYVIMTSPSYAAFQRGIYMRAGSKDAVADAKMQKSFIEDPLSIPEYAWTEADAEESAEILKSKPFFRAYVR